MNNYHGIILIIISILLIICYFAPVGIQYKEDFGNIMIKKINGLLKNLSDPKDLNQQLCEDTIPAYQWIDFTNKDGNTSFVKSDGIPVGTYMHQIIRPPDNVSINSGKSGCKMPLFSDKKHQSWCSEKNAMEYYAMRPIMNPSKYEKLLEKLFKSIVDINSIKNININTEISSQAVFCTNTKEFLMKWLMEKITKQVSKMPEMQKNGPLISELFYGIDSTIYELNNDKDNKFYKILFNLYNPSRSISTLVNAVILINDEKPTLVYIGFNYEGFMGDYVPEIDGYGPIHAYETKDNGSFKDAKIIQPDNLGFKNSPEGEKKWDEYYKKNPDEIDWNYKNTLQEQKFNKDGFYSNVPSENIIIEGGISDSLMNLIKSDPDSQKQLSTASNLDYTGIDTITNKPTNIDGYAKDVYSNSDVWYNINNPVSDRQIETPGGIIYI